MENLNKSAIENVENSEVTTAAAMQDVPLSQEEEPPQSPTIEKIPSKSSSLKRFFKLSSLKKSSNENMTTEPDAGADADIEEESEAGKSDEENKANAAQNADNVDAPASSSSHAPNPSKHSLRGSLSTYFSSVFKRRQSASSKHALRSAKKPSNADKVEEDEKAQDKETQTRRKSKANENSESPVVDSKSGDAANEDLRNLGVAQDSNTEAPAVLASARAEAQN